MRPSGGTPPRAGTCLITDNKAVTDHIPGGRDVPLDHPECRFYALIAESSGAGPGAAEPARETATARSAEQLAVIEALYGLGATLSVSRGLAPPPDIYDEVPDPPARYMQYIHTYCNMHACMYAYINACIHTWLTR